MKKITALLLALVIVLGVTGCGSGNGNSGKENASPQNDVPQNSTEPAKDKDTTTYSIKDYVVVDNDQCSLVITGVEDSRTSVKFSVVCENKTSDKTLMFSEDGVAVNGWSYTSLFVNEVAAGKKKTDTLSFSKSTLKKYGIEYIDELLLCLRIYDSDDWLADAVVKDVFYVYPTGKTKDEVWYAERTAAPGDALIVDNDDCTFIICSAQAEKGIFSAYKLNVYLKNKTDSAATFSWDDTSVNGFMCDPFWAASVPPGCSSYSEISFSSSSFKDNNIETVEEIEFELSVYNDYDIFNKLLEKVYTYNP